MLIPFERRTMTHIRVDGFSAVTIACSLWTPYFDCQSIMFNLGYKQFLSCPRIDILISLLNPWVTLIVITLIYVLTFDHHVPRKIEMIYIWKRTSHNKSSDGDWLICFVIINYMKTIRFRAILTSPLTLIIPPIPVGIVCILQWKFK